MSGEVLEKPSTASLREADVKEVGNDAHTASTSGSCRRKNETGASGTSGRNRHEESDTAAETQKIVTLLSHRG